MPSIKQEEWVNAVKETGVLLAWGSDVYLCHWLRQSSLADLLPLLPRAVYVG